MKYVSFHYYGGSSSGFRISRMLQPGAYFLRVGSYRGSYGVEYTVRLDASVDDHSDVRAESTVLTSSVTGRIDPAEDVDYFRIYVTPEAPSVTIYTTGDLDTEGALIRETSSGGTYVLNRFSTLDSDNRMWAMLDAGTYYVRIWTRFNMRNPLLSNTGDYTIHLRVSEADVHSDEIKDATDLVSSVDGVIHAVDDIDYFRIVVTEDARRVTIFSTSRGTDTYGVLEMEKDGEVEEIARNDNGDDENFLISQDLEPGTYYVKVGTLALRLEDITFGEYSISSRDVGEYSVHLRKDARN